MSWFSLCGFFSLFLLRASLGLCEQGCVDLRWVLQRSPEPGQTQLTSPTPDAHAVASHAATGNDSHAGNICFFVGNELSEAEMSSWSSSPCTWCLWLQVHIQQASVFLLKRNLSTTVVHQISQSCIDFCPEIESVYSGKDLLAARQHPAVEINGSHYNRFLFHFTLDGPDVIQQRSKFNMGALSSGPRVCNEWKTQGQPSGQTAVSHYCLKIKTEYFLFSISLALLIH